MPGEFIKTYGYPWDSNSSQTWPEPSFPACGSIWINEGYLNIKYLIGQIQEESLTGNHLLVLLSQAQLVSKSKAPYLKGVTCNRDFVPSIWLSGIQNYLQYSQSKIHIADVWIPSLQGVCDEMLMDVYEKDKPSTNTLDRLNRVWLYLGVTTLADLCDDDGVFLESWALTGYERQQQKLM
eukprot:15292961-Ditylum_brightwellii.AAC.1